MRTRLHHNYTRTTLFVLALLAFGFHSPVAKATTASENAFTEFNRECYQTKRSGERVIRAWWLPLEYWRKGASLDPSTTQQDLNDILGAFRPYLLFGIIEMQGNITTSIRYTSESDLRRKTRVKDKGGTFYGPIQQSELQDTPQEVLRLVKPGLMQHLGEMGRHMHFLFFPATDTLGRRIASANSQGELMLRVGTETIVWALPLIPDRHKPDSTVPPSNSSGYLITAQQARGLGKSVGHLAGAFVNAAYFGLYATAEGYSKRALTKKQATALVKRFRSDAQIAHDELQRIPALLGESDDTDDFTGGLRECLNSIIRQADFLNAYIESGDRESLGRYQRERDSFLDLMRKRL